MRAQEFEPVLSRRRRTTEMSARAGKDITLARLHHRPLSFMDDWSEIERQFLVKPSAILINAARAAKPAGSFRPAIPAERSCYHLVCRCGDQRPRFSRLGRYGFRLFEFALQIRDFALFFPDLTFCRTRTTSGLSRADPSDKAASEETNREDAEREYKNRNSHGTGQGP